MRILHLSDVHIQSEIRNLPLRHLGWRRLCAQFELLLRGRAKNYSNALFTLHRIVQDIETLEPDHVLFTGDMTALALEDEFLEARCAFGNLANIPLKLSVVPGNHDRYTALSLKERHFERHFGQLLTSDLPGQPGPNGYPFVRLVGQELAVIGLDSTRLAPLPGLAFGQIDPTQMDCLNSLLDHPELSNRAICIMVHHGPLLQDGQRDTPTHGLVGGDEFLRRLTGRVCSLHHGHIHRRYWHRANASRPDIFCGGSSTLKGDEGYWLIEIKNKRVIDARIVKPNTQTAQ